MSKVKSDSIINLGANIKSLRNDKELSQADVIRELHLCGFDIVKQNYSRYENGQEHIPASVLVALCGILDTTLDEIFKTNVNQD